jgi:hypothetical protein
MTAPFCVCVPARNEAERLPRLLETLAAQTIDGPVRVALCLNNCDDSSAAAVAAAVRRFPRLDIHVDERCFDAAEAHAGSARRAAIALGVGVLGTDDGVLISTDADCRAPPGWIAAIMAEMAADRIVGGRIVIDEAEPFPDVARALRARWDRYWERVRGIEDSIDPRPDEPAGRHGDHTGASLALMVGLYRAAGGIPPIPTGEDRALVENAVLAGGRLVHPPTVWTAVSPRIDGRAAGGMAGDMIRLCAEADARTTPRVPAFDRWAERARWRHTLRCRADDRAVVHAERALPPMPHDMPLPELDR